MALKLENINNLISDDLDKRNENWTEIDNTFELKADKATTYTKTEVDTKLSEKVQNFKIKNEVENGDFSNGTTGFRVLHGTTLTNVNNQGVVVFGAIAMYLQLDTPIPATISDKIYLKFNASTSGTTTLRIRADGTTLLADVSLTSTLTNYSYVATTATNSLPLRFNLLRGDVDASVTFDNILTINLTTTFGAGNEPTKEEMDELMKVIPNNWWDGELTLTQKQFITWQLNLIRKNTNAIIALGGTII